MHRRSFASRWPTPLTRNIAAGKIDFADAKVAWQRIVAIEISLHGLTDGPAVMAVACKLKRESAYDAAYIALAQMLDAELWTLASPLSRNAADTDLPVRLIGAS
jgi:predicted nucleic acid-binding protein